MQKTHSLILVALKSLLLSCMVLTIANAQTQESIADNAAAEQAVEQLSLEVIEDDGLEGIDDIQVSDSVYQIELLVFAYKNAAVDEVWESLDSYSYPEKLRRLSSSHIAEFFPVLQSNENEGELSITMGDLYQFVDDTHLQLKAMANDFRLRQGYRLLFHGAWFQQAGSAKDSSSTLIEGGNWFSPYFELSGFITFRKSRYLQLSTDLWLTQFSDSDLGHQQLPWYATNKIKPPLKLASSNDARRIISGVLTDTDTVGVLDNEDPASPLLFEYDQHPEFADSENIPLQVFRLKQKRKLRRGELHYLDHPKFGAIILARTLADVHNDSLP